MSKLLTGNEVGTKLCQALGYLPERVQSITVTAEVVGVATVTISHLVTEEETARIATVFEYFGLVKQGEHIQEHPQGIIGPGADVFEADNEWSVRARQALEQAEKEE